ncbi:expressed protein [Phakopsora pachyrhizi]|uniref:Expressed protein n=1 Tax=Phakopsora pachyrhizi TaxID=170000 RepID=A0AAV0B5H5_PHAPC|nr:expressed protein [Phakopsora pachyrhizi]
MLVDSFLYHFLLALFLFSVCCFSIYKYYLLLFFFFLPSQAATVPIPRSLLWTPVRMSSLRFFSCFSFLTSVITNFSWKTSFSSIDLLIAFDCAPG